MKTTYSIQFTEVTINGNKTYSTKWYESEAEIPAKYFDMLDAKLVTRTYQPLGSLADFRKQRANA